MCQGVCRVLELESERGRQKEVGRVKGRLVEWETLRREHCLLSNHKHQLQKEEKWDREGKKSKETDNQQCCLFCCVSVVFYLLLCLIYGSLYNEGVLQIHGCWEPPPSTYLELPQHIFTKHFPCSFIVSFVV